MLRRPPTSTRFPYTTLFRSSTRQRPLAHADQSQRRKPAEGLGREPHPVVLDPEDDDRPYPARSEEHTSELQSQFQLVCRLLLEKKNHSDYIADQTRLCSQVR